MHFPIQPPSISANSASRAGILDRIPYTRIPSTSQHLMRLTESRGMSICVLPAFVCVPCRLPDNQAASFSSLRLFVILFAVPSFCPSYDCGLMLLHIYHEYHFFPPTHPHRTEEGDELCVNIRRYAN